jgi:membrane protein YqaA with SNARE-associated domain
LNVLTAHLSLFLVATLAATILPGTSEAMLLAMAAAQPASTVSLFIAATAGNTLGAVINWALGRWLSRYADAPWFPASPRRLAQVTTLFRKYGVWTLLFSWTPFVGDPLTVVAGLLRVPFPIFVILVAIGKAARYLVVLGVLKVVREIW